MIIGFASGKSGLNASPAKESEDRCVDGEPKLVVDGVAEQTCLPDGVEQLVAELIGEHDAGCVSRLYTSGREADCRR